VKRGLAGAVALVAALVTTGAKAQAEPSIWAQAREPWYAKQKELLSAAEQNIVKYERLQRDPLLEHGTGDFARLGSLYLIEARKFLEQAGGAHARDVGVRIRLGHVLRMLGEYEAAVKVMLPIAQSELPASTRLEAWGVLALCWAKLGQRNDEIRAYGESLALEPLGPERSVLFANRAEALMGLGRLDEAIEGYRDAIRVLLPIEMFEVGVTALWGHGVALDRQGDLDGALASIKMARAYDPQDRRINSQTWFYSPPYDQPWYEALGHWTAARVAEQGAVRAEEYERAVESWQEYLARAPATDRWVPLAKARLAACEKERDQVLAAARKRSTRDPLRD
jgi:tetratricopeptide (TPR) repeat protein